ncbi:MAG: hypothetical protein IPO22_16040 [Anaerolineales bacterium]|nr:hypothetical protein [Anaerolineales bacterium]
MDIRPYRIGSHMPGLLLGILPGLSAFSLVTFYSFYLASSTSAAGGTFSFCGSSAM